MGHGITFVRTMPRPFISSPLIILERHDLVLAFDQLSRRYPAKNIEEELCSPTTTAGSASKDQANESRPMGAANVPQRMCTGEGAKISEAI